MCIIRKKLIVFCFLPSTGANKNKKKNNNNSNKAKGNNKREAGDAVQLDVYAGAATSVVPIENLEQQLIAPGSAVSVGESPRRPPPKQRNLPRQQQQNLHPQQQNHYHLQHQQQQDQIVSMESGTPRHHANGNAHNNNSNNNSDKDRKIRSVAKKLSEIKKLKSRQSQGETLELNQLDKIEMEARYLEDLKALKLSV